MAAFDKASIFRESCYDCRFNGLSRVGDITIADFWGLGTQGLKFSHDVTKGVSLVLINTEKGREVVDKLGDCFIQERPLKEAIPLNHNLVGSSVLPDNRDEVISAFNNPANSLTAINAKYHIENTDIKSRIRNVLIKTGAFWFIKSIINKLRSL